MANSPWSSHYMMEGMFGVFKFPYIQSWTYKSSIYKPRSSLLYCPINATTQQSLMLHNRTENKLSIAKFYILNSRSQYQTKLRTIRNVGVMYSQNILEILSVVGSFSCTQPIQVDKLTFLFMIIHIVST